MATNARRRSTEADPTPPAQDSSQQIWLAGLGAFAQAQKEGGKVFEALVEDGLALQRKTQAAAQAQVAEASERLAALASRFPAAPAAPAWDKLEGIFEQRVAKALQRLDIAQRSELEALRERVAALEAALAAAQKAPAKRAAPRTASKRRPSTG